MHKIVDRSEVQRLVQEERALVIDALPTKEYEDEHIAGAINLPLKQLSPDTVQNLPRDRPLIVYCWDMQ